MLPAVAIPLVLSLLSTGLGIAGNFYSANRSNQFYNAQLKDMQSYLSNYRVQNGISHRQIKHPYMGISGQINALQKGIEINNVMPWLGAGSSLLSYSGRAYGKISDFYEKGGSSRGKLSRWLD